MAKYALAYSGEKIDELLGLVDGAASNIQEQIDGIHDDIQEQINGINTELDSKASKNHTHDYAKSSHTHKASEISGNAGWETITPTRNTSATPSDSTISLKYCELTNTCMVRIYVAARQSLIYKDNTEYTLYTVPEKYRPNTRWALAASGGRTAVQATINAYGEIVVIPRCDDIDSGYVLYVSGSWIVNG